jgi:hypothetical protein
MDTAIAAAANGGFVCSNRVPEHKEGEEEENRR